MWRGSGAARINGAINNGNDDVLTMMMMTWQNPAEQPCNWLAGIAELLTARPARMW
jgi:hypothetical protein